MEIPATWVYDDAPQAVQCGHEVDVRQGSAAMINGNRQKIKNSSQTSDASPLFRLSATMVDLSLREKQPDLRTDTSAKVVPIRAEPSLPEAKGPVAVRAVADTAAKAENVIKIRHGMWPTRIGLFRKSIYRIYDRAIQVFARAWAPRRIISAVLYAALALLAILSVFALRHRTDSVKKVPQIGAPIEQQKAVTSRQKVAKNSPVRSARKLKPRRPASDYIAKDTYAYYGKDGKGSH